LSELLRAIDYIDSLFVATKSAFYGNTLGNLKTAITLDGIIGNMKALKGEKPTGTDAEVCAYLSTASITVAMDDD
jgi:hypothetical protein